MEGRMILRVTQNALLTQYRRHFQRGKEEMSLGKLRTSGNRFCDMLSWRFPVHPRWLSDVWKLMSVFSVVSWKFRVYLRCFSDVLIVEWLSDWPEMLCSLNLEDISKGGRKRWAWENSGPVGIDSVRCCPEGIECIRGAVLKVQSLSKMLYKYPENIECILCAVLKVPESICGALQMSGSYWVYLVYCPEDSGVYLRCFTDVRKPLSVCGILSWRCRSLYVVLCRCPEAIEYIWCTVLRILEYICSALQMSSEVFCRCPEGSGVYLGCIADVQKVPGSIWGAL